MSPLQLSNNTHVVVKVVDEKYETMGGIEEYFFKDIKVEPMTLSFGVMLVFPQRAIAEIKEFWILDFRLKEGLICSPPALVPPLP
jgi:hypothetical protein